MKMFKALDLPECSLISFMLQLHAQKFGQQLFAEHETQIQKYKFI